MFSIVLGVRDAKIDYIRLEVSLANENTPREEAVLRDLMAFTHKAFTTPTEYQLASKIVYKIGRNFGDALPYNLHGIFKAALDLRLLCYTDAEKVSKHIQSPEELKRNAARNLQALLAKGRRIWEHNYHYILVRRTHCLEEKSSPS